MKKYQVERYLEKRGMKGKERLTREGGGQYLDNFLVEFANYVRVQTINECWAEMKKLRDQSNED